MQRLTSYPLAFEATHCLVLFVVAALTFLAAVRDAFALGAQEEPAHHIGLWFVANGAALHLVESNLGCLLGSL